MGVPARSTGTPPPPPPPGSLFRWLLFPCEAENESQARKEDLKEAPRCGQRCSWDPGRLRMARGDPGSLAATKVKGVQSAGACLSHVQLRSDPRCLALGPSGTCVLGADRLVVLSPPVPSHAPCSPCVRTPASSGGWVALQRAVPSQCQAVCAMDSPKLNACVPSAVIPRPPSS